LTGRAVAALTVILRRIITPHRKAKGKGKNAKGLKVKDKTEAESTFLILFFTFALCPFPSCISTFAPGLLYCRLNFIVRTFLKQRRVTRKASKVTGLQRFSPGATARPHD
jgi:hypothetical protein